MDYLDAYLMHWPASGLPGPEIKPALSDTWAAMEGLVDRGLVKAIGISNFSIKKMEGLIKGARIKPAICQVPRMRATHAGLDMQRNCTLPKACMTDGNCIFCL